MFLRVLDIPQIFLRYFFPKKVDFNWQSCGILSSQVKGFWSGPLYMKPLTWKDCVVHIIVETKKTPKRLTLLRCCKIPLYMYIKRTFSILELHLWCLFLFNERIQGNLNIHVSLRWSKNFILIELNILQGDLSRNIVHCTSGVLSILGQNVHLTFCVTVY